MKMDDLIQNAKFLLVDDETVNVRLLEQTLSRWGYTNHTGTSDSREVIELFRQHQPDLILLDLMMPHLDGFAILEQLKPLLPEGGYLPIIILTADISPSIKRKALAAGAKDFLTKPFDPTELLLRIWNMLETRFLHIELEKHNQELETRVEERTRDLEEAQYEIVSRLAQAAEFRDDDTGKHTQRVGTSAALLARALQLPEAQVQLIGRAAPLHDVGKIAVSDTILLKPGKLTDQEFDVMKTHTTKGARILSGSKFPLLRLAEEIALTHHERWSGGGYPAGLAGEAIPIAGRILAVADVFDALTSQRPYKTPWTVEAARAEIERHRGAQFDPQVVDAFRNIRHDDLI